MLRVWRHAARLFLATVEGASRPQPPGDDHLTQSLDAWIQPVWNICVELRAAASEPLRIAVDEAAPLFDPEQSERVPLFPELMAGLGEIKRNRIGGLMLVRDWKDDKKGRPLHWAYREQGDQTSTCATR